VIVFVRGRPGYVARFAPVAAAIATGAVFSIPFGCPFRKRSNQASPWPRTYWMSGPGKVDGGWPNWPMYRCFGPFRRVYACVACVTSNA
jgi:hypothetical protein